jgi:hypothetical protein
MVVPLGIPLVFVLGPVGVTWRQLSSHPTLTAGIGLVMLTGLVGALRHVFTRAEGRASDALAKQTFAVLMIRWVLVLAVIYTFAGVEGRFGLYLVVAVYAAASAWRELTPERFVSLIPDRRPADAC